VTRTVVARQENDPNGRCLTSDNFNQPVETVGAKTRAAAHLGVDDWLELMEFPQKP